MRPPLQRRCVQLRQRVSYLMMDVPLFPLSVNCVGLTPMSLWNYETTSLIITRFTFSLSSGKGKNNKKILIILLILSAL